MSCTEGRFDMFRSVWKNFAAWVLVILYCLSFFIILHLIQLDFNDAFEHSRFFVNLKEIQKQPTSTCFNHLGRKEFAKVFALLCSPPFAEIKKHRVQFFWIYPINIPKYVEVIWLFL